LEHLEASLDTNRQNNKAYILKSIIKKKCGVTSEAKEILQTLLDADPLDQWAKFELATHTGSFDAFLNSSRNDAQTIIDIAFDYAEAGIYQEGIELILLHQNHEASTCAVPNPMAKSAMTSFILAWLYEKSNQPKIKEEVLREQSTFSPDYFFPSRIQEQLVLEWAVQHCDQSCLAAYGLGNYMLDKKRYEEAIKYWELAVESNMNYATLYRNLGIIYWNSKQDGAKARAYFEQAIVLSPEDMRILFEYDQLRKKLNDSPAERLATLKPLKKKILTRDDFTVELAALYNFIGDCKSALQLIESKKFHPWEGGEGQVLRQYSNACLRLGEIELQKGRAKEALVYFNKAENTPDNLGEKYHPLQAKAHIYYWKGKALKELKKEEEAYHCFTQSATEQGDFVDMAVRDHSELSYFRALSLFELDKAPEARSLLSEIKVFAEKKLGSSVKIDYFSTSLPLLLVFEDDMQKRNKWEAKYLMALSELGMGNSDAAKNLFQDVLELNAMHDGANVLLSTIK
jgi:tetratricopeptide (TPR) repeat protein